MRQNQILIWNSGKKKPGKKLSKTSRAVVKAKVMVKVVNPANQDRKVVSLANKMDQAKLLRQANRVGALKAVGVKAVHRVRLIEAQHHSAVVPVRQLLIY